MSLFVQKEETVNWLQIWCITWVSWIWHSRVPDIWSIQVHDWHACNIIRVWISWLADCNSNHNNNASLLICFTLLTDAVSAADKHITLFTVRYSAASRLIETQATIRSVSSPSKKIEFAGLKNSVNFSEESKLISKYVNWKVHRRLLLCDSA